MARRVEDVGGPSDNVLPLRSVRRRWEPDSEARAQLAEAAARYKGEDWEEIRLSVLAGIVEEQIYTRARRAAAKREWSRWEAPPEVQEEIRQARCDVLGVESEDEWEPPPGLLEELQEAESDFIRGGEKGITLEELLPQLERSAAKCRVLGELRDAAGIPEGTPWEPPEGWERFDAEFDAKYGYSAKAKRDD